MTSRRPFRQSFLTPLLLAALVGGGLVATPLPAGATPAWTITPGPAVSSLRGVSCVSANDCWAIGANAPTRFGGNQEVLEHWDGSRWSAMVIPTLPGQAPQLYGLACPSATSCFAVGTWYTGLKSPRSALIEHWDGHIWSLMNSPRPGGPNSYVDLGAVSCPSARSCYAVGSSSHDYTGIDTKSLVEHWNGHLWSIMPTPARGTERNATLYGISCPTTHRCFAVGGYDKSFVEHWNGHIWSIVPSPHASSRTSLSSVSCPWVGSCFAVGTYTVHSRTRNLVEYWNGHTWQLMNSVNPSQSTQLSAVSCPFAGSCFAVGWYTIDRQTRSLVEHWNGHHWQLMASPNVAPATLLFGVSCPYAKSCAAVGTLTVRYR